MDSGVDDAVDQLMTGRVVAFDERRGLGTIESTDGTQFPFHCTRIADGSRTIGVKTTVTFDVVPGHLGQWEAADIKPSKP
jgi:cold shock CspA family protein